MGIKDRAQLFEHRESDSLAGAGSAQRHMPGKLADFKANPVQFNPFKSPHKAEPIYAKATSPEPPVVSAGMSVLQRRQHLLAAHSSQPSRAKPTMKPTTNTKNKLANLLGGNFSDQIQAAMSLVAKAEATAEVMSCHRCNGVVTQEQQHPATDIGCHKDCFKCTTCSIDLEHAKVKVLENQLYCMEHPAKATTAADQHQSLRTCLICDEDCPPDQFQLTACCLFTEGLCLMCIGRTLAIAIGEGRSARLKCPNGTCDVDTNAIRNLSLQCRIFNENTPLSDDLFNRFVRDVRVHENLSKPNFRWCRNPGCGDGQTKAEEATNALECATCGWITCFCKLKSCCQIIPDSGSARD